jgi:predicted nucleotide-binding protein
MTSEAPEKNPWRQLQQIVAADPDLRRYLELSFESFHSTGDWPDVEKLQRQLLREREHLDLYGVGDRIPNDLGTNPVRIENQCKLTVAGIAVCANAQEEVRDFLSVLALASEKYLSEAADGESSESISSDELREALHMTDLAVRRMFRMIEWEPFIAGGDGSIEGAWRRNVGSMMRHFVGIATFDDYMRVKVSLYPRKPLLIASESLPLIGHFSYDTGPSSVPPWQPTEPFPRQSEAVDPIKPDPRRVFVVHGRNDRARDGMFTFLRALGLNPIEWSHAVSMTGQGSPYIGDVLDTAFSGAQAVVVLFTPDEVAYLKPEFSLGNDDPEAKPSEQARPNVLFESGMALGRDPRRTVLVELGRVRPFSDVIGRHVVRLDGSPKTRNDLAQRLRTAGCSIELSGADWLTAGDLTPPAQAETWVPKPSLDQSQTHKIDLKYHPAERGAGRLEVINVSAEALQDLNLAIPPEASSFQLLGELPIDRLPAGKSVYLITVRVMGGGSKTHFDVRVTARTKDGSSYEDEVFLSI